MHPNHLSLNPLWTATTRFREVLHLLELFLEKQIRFHCRNSVPYYYIVDAAHLRRMRTEAKRSAIWAFLKLNCLYGSAWESAGSLRVSSELSANFDLQCIAWCLLSSRIAMTKVRLGATPTLRNTSRTNALHASDAAPRPNNLSSTKERTELFTHKRNWM